MADGGLEIQGVDYAFPPHPSPAALVAGGFKFVVRYGGPGTEDKWIHADEAQALAAAGLWIVANAEGSAAGLAGGYTAGVVWAQKAKSWFKSIGMPANRPIYFSIDYNTDSGDWATLEAAMDGCASVIGREWVGVYGEYAILAHLHGAHKATWFWQTYAWSTGRWFFANHLEQYLNGVPIDGADCDLNRAKQTDYGQWMPGKTPTRRSIDMLLGKVKGVATVYVGTSQESRPLDSYSDGSAADAAAVQEAYAVYVKLLGEPIEFSSLEALEATLGKVGGEQGGGNGGGLTADDVRAIVNDTRLMTGTQVFSNR